MYREQLKPDRLYKVRYKTQYTEWTIRPLEAEPLKFVSSRMWHVIAIIPDSQLHLLASHNK